MRNNCLFIALACFLYTGSGPGLAHIEDPASAVSYFFSCIQPADADLADNKYHLGLRHTFNTSNGNLCIKGHILEGAQVIGVVQDDDDSESTPGEKTGIGFKDFFQSLFNYMLPVILRLPVLINLFNQQKTIDSWPSFFSNQTTFALNDGDNPTYYPQQQGFRTQHHQKQHHRKQDYQTPDPQNPTTEIQPESGSPGYPSPEDHLAQANFFLTSDIKASWQLQGIPSLPAPDSATEDSATESHTRSHLQAGWQGEFLEAMHRVITRLLPEGAETGVDSSTGQQVKQFCRQMLRNLKKKKRSLRNRAQQISLSRDQQAIANDRAAIFNADVRDLRVAFIRLSRQESRQDPGSDDLQVLSPLYDGLISLINNQSLQFIEEPVSPAMSAMYGAYFEPRRILVVGDSDALFPLYSYDLTDYWRLTDSATIQGNEPQDGVSDSDTGSECCSTFKNLLLNPLKRPSNTQRPGSPKKDKKGSDDDGNGEGKRSAKCQLCGGPATLVAGRSEQLCQACRETTPSPQTDEAAVTARPIPPVTSEHSLPGPENVDVLERFQQGRLAVRIIDIKCEDEKAGTPKPVTLLRPGSHNIVTLVGENDADVLNWQYGSNRLAVIINSGDDKFLWAYKHDACSDDQGKPTGENSALKTITSLNALDAKLIESEFSRTSAFAPVTSGHLGAEGFLVHKSTERTNEEETYPEVIYTEYNFSKMYDAPLLDFGRAASFQRLGLVFDGILQLGENGGEGSEKVYKPVYLYDSYRGIIDGPHRVTREILETLKSSATTLDTHEKVWRIPGNLYDLLTQSGCNRFYNCLLNLPFDSSLDIKLWTLRGAVRSLDSGSFIETIDAIDKSTLVNCGEIFKDLLYILMKQTLSSLQDSGSRENKEQKEILIKLFENGVTVPFVSDSLLETNPLFACLCLANGSRLSFGGLMASDFVNSRGDEVSSWFIKASEFYSQKLLTEEEYRSTQAAILWRLTHHNKWNERLSIDMLGSIICATNDFRNRRITLIKIMNQIEQNSSDPLRMMIALSEPDTETYPFPETLEELAHKLHTQTPYSFLNFAPVIFRSPYLFHSVKWNLANDFDESQCHGVIGEELYRTLYPNGFEGFVKKEAGQSEEDKGVERKKFKEYLESRLSAKRISEEQIVNFLTFMYKTKDNPYGCESIEVGGKRYKVYDDVAMHMNIDMNVNIDIKDTKQNSWIEDLLKSPPEFDQVEIQRVGRYKAITQTVGRHYYQYPHPNKVPEILANGAKPYYRKDHGIDHVLRAQILTEFVLPLISEHHPDFKKHLQNNPELTELLPLALLFHDVDAEDGDKDQEEVSAAKVYEEVLTDMGYSQDAIRTVADALRNKNTNLMREVHAPFSADEDCTDMDRLLRQIVRFGDTVDILRVIPPARNFPAIEPDSCWGSNCFDPGRIELLKTVSNDEFTRAIQAALKFFLDLACMTGGWHHNLPNPARKAYNLVNLDNNKRRQMIESAPYPYDTMHQNLDDIVRFAIAKKAGLDTCTLTHPRERRNASIPVPECFDKSVGIGGAYRKIHSELELRQINLPPDMTLKEKVLLPYAIDDDLVAFISPQTIEEIHLEIRRLKEKGISPARGTPAQWELKEMMDNPESEGARILRARYQESVESFLHMGQMNYRLVKHESPDPSGDGNRGSAKPD